MPNFSDLFGGGGIKSVQRGVVTPAVATGATVTIASVNPAKTFVTADYYGGSSPFASTYTVSANLINATTLEVRSNTTQTGTGNTYFAPAVWQVVEFY